MAAFLGGYTEPVRKKKCVDCHKEIKNHHYRKIGLATYMCDACQKEVLTKHEV